MSLSFAARRRRGEAWVLSEPPAVLLWQLGIAWSSLVAVADACTGRHVVLSGLALLGPVCVFFTGRWLRTALAGAWAIGLVVVLGVPDGIWGSRLETLLICAAVVVAVISTLLLVMTARACLSLTATAVLAACGGHAASSAGARPAARAARPVSCHQQYETWSHGSGPAQEAKLHADVATVLTAAGTAERSGNAVPLRSAMARLMPAAVATGLAGGIPGCADPARLYDEYVTGVYAAGENARSATGLGGLLAAAAPLHGLRGIESRLAAEISTALAGS
jgi:hypothetical protein